MHVSNFNPKWKGNPGSDPKSVPSKLHSLMQSNTTTSLAVDENISPALHILLFRNFNLGIIA